MAEYPGKEIRPSTATGPVRTYGSTSVRTIQKFQYVTNWYYNDADKNQYDSNTFYIDSSLGPTITRGGLKEIDIKVLYAPERDYGGLEILNVFKSFGPNRPDKIYDINILNKSTVKTGGLIPTAPTDVVFVTNRNGFRINWGHPEGDIDGRPLIGYGVFISDDGHNFVQTDTVPLNRFVFGDVYPSHTKYISIRASNFNGYGSKSTIFELNAGFDYDSQIAFARKTSEEDMVHGLYSSHNAVDDNGNSVFFALWTPQSDIDEVGRKKIMDFNSETGVNMIHILPIENSKYNIGSDDKPFTATIGSEIYTDVIKTKTFRLHAGK